MSKENPYSSTIEEVKTFIISHRNEYSLNRKDYFSSMLEEEIRKLQKDSKANKIKANENPSKEELDYLNKHDFDLSFYTEKLEVFKEFEKTYKKYEELSEKYLELLNKRFDNYLMNSQIVNQFSEEEIRKNPELKKMINDKPNGFDDIENKYLKSHFLLVNLNMKYTSLNDKEYESRLADYLSNHKVEIKPTVETVVKVEKVENNRKNEVKTTQNSTNFDKTYGKDFEILKELVNKENNISDDTVNELKHYLTIVLDVNELEYFSRFENEIINDYNALENPFMSKNSLITNSVNLFLEGMTNIDNIFLYQNKVSNRFREIEIYFDSLLFKVANKDFKTDPNKIYKAIGATNSLIKLHKVSKVEGGFFKRLFNKEDIEAYDDEESLLDKCVNYLTNKIGVDSSLLNIDVIGMGLTDDKKKELGNALTTNYMNITDKNGIIKRDILGVNKKLATYITKMIEAKLNYEDALSIFDEYHEEKLLRLLEMEEIEEKKQKAKEDKEKAIQEERRKARKIEYSKSTTKDAIRG